MQLATLILLLFLGQELDTPSPITGQSETPIVISPKTKATEVYFYFITPGLKTLQKDKKSVAVWGAMGEYRVLAIVSIANKITTKEIIVVIGEGLSLQQAAVMDKIGDKKELVVKVYDTIAKGLERPELANVGHITKGIDVVWNLTLGKDSLPNVKKAIDLHFNDLYKQSPDAPLTNAMRKTMAIKINELKIALEKIQ